MQEIQLCLFDGTLQTVDIHLKPETLHFGGTAENGNYIKELRDTSGQELSANKVTIPLTPKRKIKNGSGKENCVLRTRS